MPDFKVDIRARLAELELSPVREAEIVEELSQHLEQEYERAVSGGASADEARRQTLEQLKAPDLLGCELKRVERRVSQEQVAPGVQSKINLFGDLTQDIRYALRVLAKNPAFTIIAVIALALGIGANSAIFSVINAVLLRPLPFKHPEQLVMLWENAAHMGFPKNTPSPANFLDWQKQAQSFTGMAAMVERSFNLTGVGEPERLDGRRVSANLFDLLGVPALLGRTFVPDDDRPGTHVVLLSHSLWQRRFGSDPSVVGGALALNGESYTVVGVMPQFVQLPGFENRNDQLWVPIAFPPDEAAQRGNHFLEVIARMKPGTTLKQAQAEMETIAARLANEYPKYNTRIGGTATPLHEEIVGDIKPPLLILLGAVGFVLLIACANVANLLLARAAAREKEIALRLALGASRFRLTRQFLTESVLLAFLGAGLGLLLALAGVRVLKTFVPSMILQIQAINIDGRVLLFTASIALLTGIVFGLAPAMHALDSNLNDSLKEGGRDPAVSRKGNQLRGLLVIGEVAVSFILLIGAGLLINSFLHLRNLDPGFRTDHLLTMKVDLSELKYPDGQRRSVFFDEALRHIRALPGVQSVAVAGNLPFTYNGDSASIAVEGIPDPPPDQWPDVIYRAIGPGYFSTLGIPVIRGRDFTDQDKVDAKNVLVLSEKTDRHYWPGQDPIGKRLKTGATTSHAPWREVIGVVKDVRQNDFIAQPKMQMYFDYRQLKDPAANALVVRMTVKQGLRLVGIGMLVGLVAAFLLTRVMASLLYGISATDPITFLGISLVLLAVAILASYVPALRATKVDPIVALRAQ